MKKSKINAKNKERLEQAVYKFKFTKEQNRDLQTAFEIFDKDGTGNIDIKYLKVILRALGFEPQEDEIKRLLSTINRSDDEENNKKGFSTNTIDFEEFLDKNMYVMLGLAVVSYTLWCVDPNTIARVGNDYLFWTIPVVIVILQLYSLNIEGNSHGDPIEVILSDKLLISTSLLYGIVMFLLLYII